MHRQNSPLSHSNILDTAPMSSFNTWMNGESAIKQGSRRSMEYKRLIDYADKRLIGRMALYDGEAELIAKTVEIKGLHVEIGCLWGGTAILAMLAKNMNKVTGHVVSIDFMLGKFWNSEDPVIGKLPTPQDVYMNMIRFGLEGDISVLRCSSYPFPLAGHIKPVTALIDGDHREEGCRRDWESLKDRTKKYILFHDYDLYHPGVTGVVDEIVRADENWKEHAHINTLIVFERVE